MGRRGWGALVVGLVVAVPALLFVGKQFFGGDCPSKVGSGAVPRRVAGVVLDDEQIRNARIIVAVAHRRGLVERASAVGLMAAMQESGLRNLDHGDRDSLGVFQQRPSQGWGSAAQVQDPVYAANRFFGRLGRVPGWQSMALWRAAQAVQGSADGHAYARHAGFATRLAAALAGHVGLGCAAAATGDVGQSVVDRAVKQVGVPYSWGGGGPGGPTRGIGRGAGTVGFDCSGLTQYAWAPWTHLDRIAADQYSDGQRVPIGQAQPGDLVFWSDAGHTQRGIHHVAIYTGRGRIVEAPHTGTKVRIRTLRLDEYGLMPNVVRPVPHKSE